MAFLDNPTIIVAHIQQSHVNSDATGMCEKGSSCSSCGEDSSSFNAWQQWVRNPGSSSETQGYVYAHLVRITWHWEFVLSDIAQRVEFTYLSSHGYKHLCFESDAAIVNELVL